MAVVHERVHQRARQQERVRQDAQHVGTMLGEEQEAADDRDDQQRKAPRERQNDGGS